MWRRREWIDHGCTSPSESVLRSSDSSSRHPACDAADRITASQIPSWWSVAKSAAARMISDDVSITGNVSRQLSKASRASPLDFLALRTSTLNSSPRTCTGMARRPAAACQGDLSAARRRSAPLMPSAYARTFVSSASTLTGHPHRARRVFPALGLDDGLLFEARKQRRAGAGCDSCMLAGRISRAMGFPWLVTT